MDEFIYSFSVYGSRFYAEHIGTWPNGGINKLVGQHFPVAFDSLNPNNGGMLITPKDFEYYNMIFPDSLKWVLTYYN